MNTNHKPSTQEIKGSCTGYTDKVIFPKSQIKIIDGEVSKGAAL